MSITEQVTIPIIADVVSLINASLLSSMTSYSVIVLRHETIADVTTT